MCDINWWEVLLYFILGNFLYEYFGTMIKLAWKDYVSYRNRLKGEDDE